MTDNVRTHKVGSHTMRVNRREPTSSGRSPLYAICTPDRWGLRYSDEDKDRDGQLAYPVARDYARAILAALTGVQWGNAYFGKSGTAPSLRLQWPLDDDSKRALFLLIKPSIMVALTSPTAGFGIPGKAVPENMGFYTPSPGSSPGEQGAFVPGFWSLNLNINMLEPMFRITTPAPASDVANRNDQLTPLRTFADTLYHEARHCQQWFWIFALVQQHPDNFESIPNISKWLSLLTTNPNQNKTNAQSTGIVELSASQKLTQEPTTLISLKRMAVGQYVYTLNVWRNAEYIPPYLKNATEMEAEFQRARAAAIDLMQHVGIGGASIDVDAMVSEPSRCYCDYTARPWENDAFFCGEMATAYWKAELGLALATHEPDRCSRAYEHADANSRLATRLADAATDGSGTESTWGQ